MHASSPQKYRNIQNKKLEIMWQIRWLITFEENEIQEHLPLYYDHLL